MGLEPLRRLPLDGLAHAPEIAGDLEIGEPEYANAQSLEVRRPLGIVGQALLGEVRLAIHLDGQFCRRTVEIQDEVPDLALPIKPRGVAAQKPIPELTLHWGRVFAAPAGEFEVALAVVEVARHGF